MLDVVDWAVKPTCTVNQQLLKVNPMGMPRVGVVHECKKGVELSSIWVSIIGGQSVCVLECRVGSLDENRLLILDQILENAAEGIQVLPYMQSKMV